MVFNRKITIVQILGIATLVFLGAAAINNNTKEGKNSPSPEIQQLDAKLLVDLQQQEISIDDRTKCLMECAEIQENDLRSLLNINNVNYEKCEAGNCHVTSYTLEGKTQTGKAVSFKIDAGEDGNNLHDLKLTEANCDC